MAVLRPRPFALEPHFMPTPPVISGRVASDDSIPSLSLDGLMKNPFDKGFIPLLPYAADDGPTFTLVATPTSLLRAAAAVPKVETPDVPTVASAAVPALPSVSAAAVVKVESPDDTAVPSVPSAADATVKVESPPSSSSDTPAAPIIRTPRLRLLGPRPPIILSLIAPLARHRAATKIVPVTIRQEFTIGAPDSSPAPPVRFANGVLFLRRPRYERVVRAVRRQHRTTMEEFGVPAGPEGREEVEGELWVEMEGPRRVELTREAWGRWAEAALMRPGRGRGR
ncbi:hypothetical protein LTR35_016010 [Friedmanniomyces endolithicus]|uniref:Uncharacterized protein n=1 Tax=Friedmanniomyces endolithicus TaxID=329885 RepID=A0AAN6F991_9PEZI|nr:hypothetical protein LTR35_016010 [Friedmanniomyces endolithicus]KAK0273772.1 hypothetical protein LTS00_015704 [Friedmanniomyces endolithicus]KAK0308251.1 hypothetical protein LTR82_015585 [Friedmanniomyces endolithicus]KAK0976194.1 hypothetical protein LTR54_016613 [Friedmanniomyces endolithicus]